MKIVTPDQMREIDRRAIRGLGIPGLSLMERAGEAVARAVTRLPEGSPIHCFCGRGNNGGDGFVAARYLKEWGREVEVWLLGSVSSLQGDVRTNCLRAQETHVAVHEVRGSAQLTQHLGCEPDGYIAVDAILGTGAEGAPRGLFAQAVTLVNGTARHIVAIDCPTGLNAATGEVGEPCVRAGTTVTMGLPKLGLLLWPGTNYVGELIVADIGFPEKCLNDPKYRVNALSLREVGELLPQRARDAHKGSCGRVLVVAGSVGYTGAAALTAKACLRGGAGLVYVGIPESLNDVMEVKLTEAITVPLPETPQRTLSSEALDPVLRTLKRVQAFALGPGISQHPATVQLVKELLPQVTVPCVVDADGLNALAPLDAGLALTTGFVLTPHPGEMARLVQLPIAEIQADRVRSCQRLAERLSCVVLLKGVPTVVASPDGDVYINRTGNPGMASAGTGDVLTGLIAALLGQGVTPLNAAAVAAYLHGRAGDIAAARKSEMGMVASDLLEALPAALHEAGGEQEASCPGQSG